MSPNNGQNPNLIKLPSWEVIEKSLCLDGDRAYRCALEIVYAWCHEKNASIADLERRPNSRCKPMYYRDRFPQRASSIVQASVLAAKNRKISTIIS